jgi:hypothetical protein
MEVRLVALLVVLTAPNVASAQQLTLPELARLHAPEPVIQSSIAERISVPLKEVLSGADLVVHGVVIKKADSSATNHSLMNRPPLHKYEGMTVSQFEGEIHRLSR